MNVAKTIIAFFLATAVFTGGVWLYSYYKHKPIEGTVAPTEEIQPDTVIKVEPQNFPINDVPDEYFGKKVELLSEYPAASDVLPMSASEGKILPFVDEVVFRESVVAFNQKVAETSPDEQSFSQKSQNLYNSAEGIDGFVTVFETEPSKLSIIVMGVYEDEDNVLWMSTVTEGGQVDLTGHKEAEGGHEIYGNMNGQSFMAFLSKETSRMALDMTPEGL